VMKDLEERQFITTRPNGSLLLSKHLHSLG
jgi:hypothetical protein